MRMVASFLRLLVVVAAVSGMAAGPLPAAAQRVDLELVLSVDSSGSIDGEEFVLQRQGYAQALTHPEIVAAMTSGPYKSIAVTLVEWSGPEIHNQVVGWTRIASKADAEAVAHKLILAPRTIFGGGTSIGGAIAMGTQLLRENGFQGTRRVIDIAGDGPNNRGPWPGDLRDAAVAEGITINGLPILAFEGDWLANYFREAVIGGPGAFVQPAQGFVDFARAIRKKLLQELQMSRRDGANCCGG